MKRTRDELINSLTADVVSQHRNWSVSRQTLGWLLLGMLLVWVLTLALGPLRPGVLEQLTQYPRFLLETLLGVAVVVLFGIAAMKTAVPAGQSCRWLMAAALIGLLWLANYFIGLVYPTMELGMLGKRVHCIWESVFYALPVMAMGFCFVGKGYVLNWPLAGGSIGLVSGLIPGQVMQMACMYEAEHSLVAHFAPAIPLMLLGWAAGVFIQYRSTSR